MATTPIYHWHTPDLSDPANVPADLAGLATAVEGTMSSEVGLASPVGSIVIWPTATLPAGWLICDGSQVASVTYPKLVAILGELTGQITLPDLRERVPVGAGASRALGSKGGAAAVALAVGEMPVHAHSITDPGHAHTMTAAGWHNHGGATGGSDRGLGHQHSYVAGGGGASFTTGSGNPVVRAVAGYGAATGGEGAPDHLHGIAADPGHTHGIYGVGTGISIQNAGSGTAHENMPPFLAINYIIKAA